jgi:uncharacterized protein (TIGR02145 family)
LLLAISNFLVFSQAPEKINYQAVIRNSSNELLINQDVSIKVSILDEISSTTALYSEEHTVSTNAYGLVNLEIGDGTIPTGNFSTINWDSGERFLKIEIDENGGSSYTEMGVVQLLSVPYALYAKSANNLGEANIYSPATDTLFVVKDHSGNVVFAVFPDGAAVYVNEAAKGKVGGFAVSGRTSVKGVEEEYLIVTPDSTRVYVNEVSVDKGKVGGFAVSGRTSTKGAVNDYLQVTRDSTRIYVKENTAKGGGGGGGFAVGEYNDLSSNSSGNFLDLTPLNSFIGLDAGKSNTTGERNAFIGYQAGLKNTEGFDNIFVGNESGIDNLTGSSNIFLGTSSGKNNTSGGYNIFIGTKSGESNTTGLSNISIGEQAGSNLETGLKNIFIGVKAGEANVEGLDNVFIGNFAGNKSTGSSNVYIGRTTGMNNTVGAGNVFIGEQSGRSNVEGSGNVFIGKGAGQNELGSNRLYISNSYTDQPLLYGEFDNGLVEVKGSVNLTNILNLSPKTSYPGSPAEGDVFYDKNTHSIKFFNGTEWMELSATSSAVSPPIVTTDSIPDLFILADSCLVYANISDQGGSPIIESGVCYSQIPFYDFGLIYGSVQSTPVVGPFSMTLTGLYQYQEFYIRAYARNSEGTSMGEMITIMTPIASSLPSVESNGVLNISQTSATGGGNVSKPGGVALTAVGICWSTTPGPTIANNLTSESVALGTFISNISGLIAETTYYVRAYATNSNGTAYGEEVVFTTASDVTTVSDIDGNVYNTIQIGTQTWMKENLKTTKYNDGSSILNITDNTEWLAQINGAYCWYDNDSVTYSDPYGALYNYYAVEDSRNMCPVGWHVATDTDWEDLSTYLGGDDIAGGKLRETGTVHWATDPGVDNSSGFTGLPGGYLYDTYGFLEIGYFGQWWAAEKTGWIYYMQANYFILGNGQDLSNSGSSVRCIKD